MARSLEMNFIREILRLNEKLSLSQRETAKAIDITYSKAIEMKDDELKNLIYPNSNSYRDIPEPDME